MTLKGLKRILKNPKKIIPLLGNKGMLFWIPDKAYLKLIYNVSMGKKLNLDTPQTFNEKLQWLKLYDRNPEYTKMVDKYEVKKYVAEKIGEEYIIPTLGVWDSFDDIDFDKLPEQFVLKCTHDSGGLVICRDKSKLDIDTVKRKVKRSLNRNYFYSSREWPYKKVKPRIIIEKYMKNNNDTQQSSLNVYKIFCFDGDPKIIQTIQNDKTELETIDYFDTEWNILDIRQNFPNSKHPLECPKTLHIMLEKARILSRGHAFIRTDFYEIDNRVYFSELTFYSDSGMAKFNPEEWDLKLGEYIKLPIKNKD